MTTVLRCVTSAEDQAWRERNAKMKTAAVERAAETVRRQEARAAARAGGTLRAAKKSTLRAAVPERPDAPPSLTAAIRAHRAKPDPGERRERIAARIRAGQSEPSGSEPPLRTARRGWSADDKPDAPPSLVTAIRRQRGAA